MNIFRSGLKLILIWGLILILSATGFSSPPAIALLRQQEEAPGQILYQARHTLKDNAGNAWQVVLFKRVKNDQVQDLDLRLIGFPGQVEFAHPQDLSIQTSTGQNFAASDQFAEHSPALNVGQYQLKSLLPNILDPSGIQLQLPLTSNSLTTLKIPAPVILEWHEILAKNRG